MHGSECRTGQCDFNVTEYRKLIDKISNHTLQLTFKKLPHVKFWYNIKEYPSLNKNLKYSSLFQLHTSVKETFFTCFNQNNILQLTMQKLMGGFSCLLWSRHYRDLQKRNTALLFSPFLLNFGNYHYIS